MPELSQTTDLRLLPTKRKQTTAIPEVPEDLSVTEAVFR